MYQPPVLKVSEIALKRYEVIDYASEYRLAALAHASVSLCPLFVHNTVQKLGLYTSTKQTAFAEVSSQVAKGPG